MGFLDRLRGENVVLDSIVGKLSGGDDSDLSVEITPEEPTPGDPIGVRFDVSGGLDDKCTGITVTLNGDGYSTVVTESTNHEGVYSRDEDRRTHRLHQETESFPAQVGPGQATFTLPRDAPPSSKGAVRWTVEVRVARKKGRDKVLERELKVRRHPEDVPTEAPADEPKDGITFEGVPAAVRAGETVTGHVSIDPPQDLSVTAVRLRLHRHIDSTMPGDTSSVVQTVPNQHGTKGGFDTEQVAETELSGKRDFALGRVERLPFSITVPADAGPTTKHADAEVKWQVEAMLDRRMRGDLSNRASLTVY